jgi:hypothetical protein
MYYLVIVDHNSLAVHLTRSDFEGFSEFCISIAVDGTDNDMLWNVRSECEEDEGTDCEGGDSATEW